MDEGEAARGEGSRGGGGQVALALSAVYWRSKGGRALKGRNPAHPGVDVKGESELERWASYGRRRRTRKAT